MIDGQEQGGRRPAVARFTRWAAPGFLAYLMFPIAALVDRGLPALQVAAGLAGLALFAVLFVRTVWAAVDRPHANPAPRALATLIAVSLLLLPVMGAPWLLAASYYIVGVYLLTQPNRRWIPGVGAVLAADAVLGALVLREDTGTVVATVLQIAVFGAAIAGFYRFTEVMEELRAARAELARSVVAQERLRIARDLHDILGQRLTAITLKTQLAQRILHRDPDWAEREIAEAERAARATLDDVRATVSGYRRVSLASELATARTLLRSARIGVVLPDVDRGLPDRLDEAAAWVVREGVTNVLRHAGARRCVIEVAAGDPMTVTVTDDGPRNRGARLHPEFGQGLTGLSERVEQAGGRVTVSAGEVWFTLRAELPATTGKLPEPTGGGGTDAA